MSRPDEPERPLLRLGLRAMGGMAVLAGLAGCTGDGGSPADGSDGDDADADPDDASNGDDGDGEETDDGDDTDDSGGRESDPDASDDEDDLTAEECEAEIEGIEADIAETGAEIDDVTPIVDGLQRRVAHLDEILDRLSPMDESIIADAEAVGRDAREAVVVVDVGDGAGTGWFVDDRHVITNAHNVVNEFTGDVRDDLTLWFLDGASSDASVVDYEPDIDPDIAILRSDDPAPATLDLAADPAADGDVLVQVGHPGGVGNWVISVGVVAEADYYIGEGRKMLSDVPGAAGVSGSPVLTLDGRVVGMTSAGEPTTDHEPGERPGPHPPIVYDRPLPEQAETIHEGLADMRERYEAWT